MAVKVDIDESKLSGVADGAQRAARLKASKSTITVHADGMSSRLEQTAAGGKGGRRAGRVQAGRRSGATMTVKIDGEKKTVNVANKTEMSDALDAMGISAADKKKVFAAAKRSGVKTGAARAAGCAAASAGAPARTVQKAQEMKAKADKAVQRVSFSDYEDAADAGDWAGGRIEARAKEHAKKEASKLAGRVAGEAKTRAKRRLLGARTRVSSSATTQREARAARQAGKSAAAGARRAQAASARASRAAETARRSGQAVKGVVAAAAKNPYVLAVAGVAAAGLLAVFFLIMLFNALAAAVTAGGAYEEEQQRLASMSSGKAFLAACQAEVDEGEHPGGEKYWRFMGFSSRVSWCASFMSYCADKAGLSEGNPLPKSASVATWMVGVKGKQHYARDYAAGTESYTPKAGDIIIWYNGIGGGPSGISHVGVVEEIDADGVIHTIEGNTSDKSMRRTHGKLADARYDIIIEPEWPQMAGDGSLMTDFSESEESFVEGWGNAIDAMYASYSGGSAPLSGYGKTMARAAYKYKIDPRLCAAISIQESSGGRYCIKPHNAWGWAAYNDNTSAAASWGSWEEAIEGWHKGMANSPALWPKSSLHDLAQSYCVPPDAWEEAVGQMMGKITR